MKNTKAAHISFAFYDRANLEKYLEEQAAQGLMIVTYGQNMIRFRRIHPQKLHFSIVYHHTPVTINRLTSEQLEYLEFCGRTGWYLVAAERRMLILANPAAHPIPIETDPQMQLENIHKSVKKQHIASLLTYIALGLLYFIMAAHTGIVDSVSGTSIIFFLPMGIWYCAQGLPDIIGYYLWRKKAKAAAEDGTFYNGGSANAVYHIIMLLAFVLCAGLLVVLCCGNSPILNGIVIASVAIAALFSLCCLLLRRTAKISAGRCRGMITLAMADFMIICIVIYTVCTLTQLRGKDLTQPSDMPISITELTDVKFAEYSTIKYTGSSLLLTQDEYRQDALTFHSTLPELRYTITYVHADFLYDVCQKELLRDFARHGEAITVDASGWNAEAAYQFYAHGSIQNDYLLCYDGYFVEIRFGWEPTAEQMTIVGQKLADK
jgi:hypothetical protein